MLSQHCLIGWAAQIHEWVVKSRVAGAGAALFGWSRLLLLLLLYCKYFFLRDPNYEYKYDYDYEYKYDYAYKYK